MGKSVFLWCQGIDAVLRGDPHVAGIPVQMSFWGRMFTKHQWEVYSLSNEVPFCQEFQFFALPESKFFQSFHLSFIYETYLKYKILSNIHPQLVVVRGATRDVFQLFFICRILKIKLVYFGASDVNFDKTKDRIENSNFKTHIYRLAVKNIPYIVVQNQYQKDCLKKYYHKDCIVIPQIWITGGDSGEAENKYDVIWVANMRKLKRVEWVLKLAKAYPQYKFAIAGGPVDKGYYESIKSQSAEISNLDFLGPKPFAEVTQLISKSRLLICTSEYEGFPNTFIQAWAYNKPVVTTVDPSAVIVSNNLGVVSESIEDLGLKLHSLLNNCVIYQACQQSIDRYFFKNHSADESFENLLRFVM